MNSSGKNIKPLILVLLLIALSLEHVFGQDILFQSLTVKNGLSNSYINCVLQDRIGFIWFGTDDGLNRFDGYDIKVYRNIAGDSTSLSDNIIWSMLEDRNGYLWIGTKNGKLNRYDPYKDNFRSWALDPDETSEKNITFLAQDRNDFIWIATYKHGLYRFDPGKNKFENWTNDLYDSNVLSSNFVTCVLEDDSSNVWVSTYNGLNKFNPLSPQRPFIHINKNINELPIWYLKKSSFFEKTFWIGKLDGLLNFNPATEETTQIILPENPTLRFSNSVSSLVEESFLGEKILWIGTYGGLVRYNLTAGEGQRYVQNKITPSGILSNQINDVIIDRSGVVWIATDNGANFYSPKRSKFNFPVSSKFLFLEPSEIKNGNIRAITQTSDGTLWFGTEGGLYNVNTKNNTPNKISGLESLNTWCLFTGKSENLWIGTYGQGLKEINIKLNTVKTWRVENPRFNAAPYSYIKTLMQDNNGMLWIGFWGGGLARLNPLTSKINYWREEPDVPQSLSYNDIWSICQDRKGRIWIGTNGGGLNLYNERVQNSFQHWRASDKDSASLINNNIYTIVEATHLNAAKDQTILWIGTANGLNKFTIQNDSENTNASQLNIRIKSYTVDDGLPDNAIECIQEDDNGNLWIGTSSSISFFDLEKETFTNFNSADGLNGGAFNSCAAFMTSDGTMLFGSTSGTNFFNPKSITQSKFSPPVVITDFQIFNQPGDLKNNSTLQKSLINIKEIILSYNQNDFSFQFASLDFNAPEAIQYAYMMEGFDDDWIFSGKRRFVTYTNLDPGEYVFQVKATNSDGLWSNQFAKIFIVITPPFWQTWWAYSIYVIVFIGSLIFLREVEIKRRQKKEAERLKWEREEARIREAELKAKNIEQENEIEKQKMRNRIAQDLHDEIGSNLSSISLMSELIQKDEKPNQKISEKLNRIYKVAKGSTQAMRDIVWLTNPSSDSLRDLIVKMREVADNTLGKFNLNFSYPKDVAEVNLLPETKRNIFFIYKETLNNIVKHAEAKSVEIEFDIKDQKIFLSIKDDGKGFNTSASFNGNGLKNVKARAKEINADLSFESSPGHGVLLKLSANIT